MAQSLPLLHPVHNIYMSDYTGQNIEYSDNIIIHRKLLHEITQNTQQENIHVLLQNTENPSCQVYGTIGWPHYDDPGTVYLPLWMMEKLGTNTPYFENPEHSITLEIYHHPIPPATHIIFKSIYSEKQTDALRNCIEESLHGFHILEEKTLIHTNEGDYVSIEKIEPATIVRLGGEVSIEIQSDLDISGNCINTENIPTSAHASAVSYNEELIPSDNKTPEQRREEVRNSWLKRFK